MNNLEWLREIQRPVREYNERFPEHQLKPGVHKWAVNLGNEERLELDLIEAVRSGKPITEWKTYVTRS